MGQLKTFIVYGHTGESSCRGKVTSPYAEVPKKNCPYCHQPFNRALTSIIAENLKNALEGATTMADYPPNPNKK